MSYSRLVKLNKIKEEALARGDQETADKAQQFMDDLQQDFSLAAEETKGLSEPIVEKQREAQSTYNKNLDRSKKLDRIIQKAERELDQETLDTALQMKLQVDDEIRRHEGIEGDIVGASLAITEGITGGIIGDETCTPGYYNNEGQPIPEQAARNVGYPQGAIPFFNYQRKWRESVYFLEQEYPVEEEA